MPTSKPTSAWRVKSSWLSCLEITQRFPAAAFPAIAPLLLPIATVRRLPSAAISLIFFPCRRTVPESSFVT